VYTKENVEAAARLLPRLNAPVLIADPNRNGARHLLAAARASFRLHTDRGEEVSLHSLIPRPRG